MQFFVNSYIRFKYILLSLIYLVKAISCDSDLILRCLYVPLSDLLSTFESSRKRTVQCFEERLGLRLRFGIVRLVSGFNSGTGCMCGSFPTLVSLRRLRNRYLIPPPFPPSVSDIKSFLYVEVSKTRDIPLPVNDIVSKRNRAEPSLASSGDANRDTKERDSDHVPGYLVCVSCTRPYACVRFSFQQRRPAVS